MKIFTRILVAFDGSPGAERALTLAAQIAGHDGSELLILSIVEHLPRFPATVGEVDETVREQMEALRALQRLAGHTAAEHGVVSLRQEIEIGNAVRLIVHAARRERAGLLVLGQSRHWRVWRRFMGSTAEKIVRRAPCAVLIAH